MNEIENTTAATPRGRITLDDVKAALEQLGGDPFSTNAAKIREVLGRGSLATIQRHLETIRQEVIAERMPPETGEVPPMPKDLMQNVWEAAWQAASSSLLERCQRLADEKERLGTELAAAVEDRATLVAETERLEAALDESEVQRERLAAELAQKSNAFEAKISEMAAEQERLRQEMDARIRDLEAKLHESELQRQAVQDALDRATEKAAEREGELRAQLAEAHTQIARLTAIIEKFRSGDG